MAKNGERKTKLLEEAIDASIKFERLMDKTDFDSWLEDDTSSKLEKMGQEVTPFKKFRKNKEKIENICCKMKKKGSNELPISRDISSLEKYIVYKLFESKNNRLEARKCSKKEDEKEKYKEGLPYLLSALNEHDKFYLQMKQNESNKSLNPGEDSALNRWLILLYNDLSICYAGLENSSMSYGYAEEARRIIEKEKNYKEFDNKLSANNSTNWQDIKYHDFVSSKLFELYTVTIFNQAEAGRRSNRYAEAEKNFKKIINYGEKNTSLINFNHYSAILYLSLLYIDQGRGKEAIELLDEVINKSNEADIPYWKAFIAKSQALIDQSEYDKAIALLSNKFFEKQENSYVLNKEHKVTSQGFKGLNYFTSCQIEKVKNTLKITKSDKAEQLNEVKNLMEKNIKNFKERKQKGFETKAYKHLSEIYEIMDDNKNAIKYLTKYLSNGDIGNLKKFVRHEKMGDWINDCIDLDALESFSKELVIALKDEPEDEVKKYQDLINILIEKIKQECGDKDQLSRSERLVANLNEVVGKREVIRYKEGIFFKESSRGENKGLSEEEIRIRLDINEKGFDSALFKRSEMKKPEHIAEVIVLRRWNSFSPGLYRESTGSLGGGYLLRIKKNSYLFSFSDIAKEKERQELLNRLRALDHSDLAKIMEGAKYSEEGRKIRITKNNERIVTLKIEEGLCYLEWQDHELEIGVVKKEDDKLNIYSGNSDVENIVIDPGYNFLRNFRSEGFHVEDIDTIIVTHSHLDHCAELLPIMDLIYQFNKRYESTPNGGRQKKRVNLCLSQGTYKKFSSYTNDPDWQRQLKDVIILENLGEMKWEPFKGLKISAVPTPHMDLGGVNAIGLKIEIEEKKLCLGFTGDTPWDPKIKKRFKACDLLCVHLGSIKYQEIGYTDDRYNLKIKSKPRKISSETEQRKEVYKKYGEANHLLFYGTLDFIECCADKDEPLIIVGEFGEELKYGLRRDLCEKLCREVNEKRKEKRIPDIVCLPGDIGLYVGIDKDGTKKVRCNFCEEFVEQEEIETFSSGREDAIHYICKTCNNTLSELQKQAFIEHRVTRH